MSTKEITLKTKIPFYHPLELHLSMTKVVLKGVKIINLSTVLHCVDMFSQDWHTQGHISIHFYIVLARVPSHYNWQEKPIRQSFAQSGLHPSILITGRFVQRLNFKTIPLFSLPLSPSLPTYLSLSLSFPLPLSFPSPSVPVPPPSSLLLLYSPFLQASLPWLGWLGKFWNLQVPRLLQIAFAAVTVS